MEHVTEVSEKSFVDKRDVSVAQSLSIVDGDL